MASKPEEIVPEASLGAKPSQSAKSARQEGNDAYQAGNLKDASLAYLDSVAICDQDMRDPSSQPKALKIGQIVEYSPKGYFGVVMSVFPLFDEYFLKDLGSNQPIWVGDPGGTLQRFDRKDLVAVSKEMVDFRMAVYCNLAVVALRGGDNQQTLVWCDRALCIQGRAPKALLRKGAALLKLNQPGPASDVLTTAAEELPDDVEVRKLLREAKKRRSPTWVCVSGCCGPWGIVCGGPVAETMASVVAPARANVKAGEGGDKILDPSTDAATDTTAAPEVVAALGEIADCSSCSSDCDSEDEEDQIPKTAAKSPWAFVLDGRKEDAIATGDAAAPASPAQGAGTSLNATAAPVSAAEKVSSPTLRQRNAISTHEEPWATATAATATAKAAAVQPEVESSDRANTDTDKATRVGSKPPKKLKTKAQATHSVTILLVIAGVSTAVAVVAALCLVSGT